MNKIPLFLFSFFFGLNAFAQYVDKAMDYFNREKYDSAGMEFEAALPLIELKYGATDTSYYSHQVELAAHSYENCQQYDKAEKYYIQVKSIYETIQATKDIRYATTLYNLAGLYYVDMGNYEVALPLYEEAKTIFKEVLGPKDLSYAKSLSNIGMLYSDMGNYESALPLLEETKNIKKEVLGSKHPYYATALNNLAVNYNRMGNYESALLLFKEASAIDRNALGTKDPDYATDLDNLAMLYSDMGNNETALILYKESIEIYKEVLGDKNLDFAIALNNLATLYVDMGSYDVALPLFEEASAIDRDVLGTKHPDLAVDLDNLAYYYRIMGNYEAALPLQKEAIKIFKEVLGDRHPDYAISLYNLAMLYSDMGYYEDALPLYEEAKYIRKEVLGNRHPDYVTSLNKLAGIYYLLGNSEAALPLFEEANGILNQNLQNNFSFLSKHEKEKYLSTVGNTYEIYLSFLKKIYLTYPRFCSNGYDNELLLKGLVLNSVTAMQQAILESGDTSLTRRYEQMRVLKRQITSEQQRPFSKRRLNLSVLEQQSFDLESYLTQHTQTFSDMQAFFKIKWEDVQNQLKDNEASVEFISFRYYNGRKFTDSTFYCALVLRKSDTLPRFIFLCKESELKKAIPPLGATLKDINLSYYGHALYNLVWHPIDSLLRGINIVYFAPSGLLNRISMAAISYQDNKTLMEKYKLEQLSSTRTLALPCESKPISNAVVYGGIVYDADTITLLTKAKKYRKNGNSLLAYNRSATGTNRSGFRYLPGTRKEAELISAKLRKSGLVSTTYLGTDALEESFVSLSGKKSPSIIHMSTHGFYFPDTISDKRSKEIDLSSSREIQFRYFDDPLLRSGLLMAGANLAWKGFTLPPNMEDGILTAKEVSNMNLMNTQLVVLSACQTGLGDVKGSEGVEGLQRGFKMAGVRYIMMSLWEVPDKETTEFMTSFYDNWLGGKDIRDAFHATQVTMKNKYNDEPYKWAGFVLTE